MNDGSVAYFDYKAIVFSGEFTHGPQGARYLHFPGFYKSFDPPDDLEHSRR